MEKLAAGEFTMRSEIEYFRDKRVYKEGLSECLFTQSIVKQKGLNMRPQGKKAWSIKSSEFNQEMALNYLEVFEKGSLANIEEIRNLLKSERK